MESLIKEDKTIIPACDVNIQVFEELLRATCDIEKIGAYKIGIVLALTHGLVRIVELARKYTSKPLIYDHQKGGTDIPDLGREFSEVVKTAGLDAIILFPQSGPKTLTAWVSEALQKGLRVIVGGYMTHSQYLASEGGYITDDAKYRIYLDAAKLGITHFVVPGNNPNFISEIRSKLQAAGVDPIFYAPGFIAQGGQISDAAKVAGSRWHAIVGRALYGAKDIREAAVSLTTSI